jgi:hypothetical protein
LEKPNGRVVSSLHDPVSPRASGAQRRVFPPFCERSTGLRGQVDGARPGFSMSWPRPGSFFVVQHFSNSKENNSKMPVLREMFDQVFAEYDQRAVESARATPSQTVPPGGRAGSTVALAQHVQLPETVATAPSQRQMHECDMAAVNLVARKTETERRALWATRFQISSALQAEFGSSDVYAAYMEGVVRTGRTGAHGHGSPFKIFGQRAYA